MIDWVKKQELKRALAQVRDAEKRGKTFATFLPGYTGDFVLYVQFGMWIQNIFVKNIYKSMVFELSRN